MSLLDELRAAYPDNEKLKALSDPELVSLYSQATGASLDLSAMDLGLDPNDYIQNTGRVQDLVNQGILGLGDIVSGVAGFFDIPIAAATDSAPFSKAVDWAADATGLSDYAKRLDVTMSPQSQETRTAWDKTWNDEEMGAWDKAKNFAGVLWDDPAYALEFAARSAPTLVPAIGGAKLLGMGAKAMEAAGLTRTAAAVRPLIPGMAEGGVAAGYQMNNLLEEDVGPREAAGYSALTGAGTGLIGGVTGALGARAGLTDPHRRLAGYRLPDEAPALPWYQRIPGGIAMEAGQEALQSPWEQAMTNVATDQPWDQGLARSAVEGAIGGGIIGAPFNVFRGREIDLTKTSDTPETEQQATPVPPGVNPPGDRTPHIDPLAAERQRQIDAIMGGETSQTVPPGQADPGSLQGLTREQVNQRMIDAAMGGETSRTFAPGQYPSDVAADLSQQQARLDAVKAAEQAKKAREQAIKVMYNGVPPVAEAEELLKTPGVPTLEGKGKTYTKGAVKYANTLAGLDAKGLDAETEALKKNTTIKAEELTWKRELIGARRAQLAKVQNAATNTGKPNPDTSTEADAKTRVNPTTSSIVAPDGVNAVPEGGPAPVVQDDADEGMTKEMPPITPTQYNRAKANGIRSTSDLDIAHRTGELDVPTPPPSPTTPETPTNALSGQTTPQAGQETRTTAPDATTEPGVAGAPSAPLVTPTGRKRRETPPPPKAQGKSAVAPGMGKTTTAPTSAEAPSMEFLTDRDAVSAKVREQYGNIVSSLPILSKPKNQIRLRSEEDRGPVTELMTNAFIDYMDTLIESRGVGESDQGLRTIATEISDSINESGGLVRKDGQPTTVSHTWVGNQLKLLASKAKTDPTLAALSARAQALRISEAAAEAAERGDALDSDMKTVDINDAERMGLDDEKAAAPAIEQAGDAVLEEEPDEADTAYLYDNAVNIGRKRESGATTDSSATLGKKAASLWLRANADNVTSPEDEMKLLASMPDDYRGAIRTAVDTSKRQGELHTKSGAESSTLGYAKQPMNREALFATLRGIRARYLADRDRSNQTQPAERDVYTPPPVASSYFGDKYEQFRGGASSLAPFAELEKVLKPAVLKQYEYMWDSATTVETQSALAARINKTYETARARQPRPDQQPAAAQPQPVAADEPVNQDRDGQAVVGGERAGEGAGVPGPDRGPGVGGVRRAGDTGQGQGAGRAVAERGQPAGGIDISAPERLVANKLAKGASPRKVTRPMARIWQEAANQDPISDVSNMSEGTAQQELEEVNAVLATQGVDGVAAWMNPVNRAMGITKLRRELLDKAKQAAQAEPQVQQGLGEDVAATNPTTEQTLRDTIASLLGKGHNWRIHVYATPEAAHAAGHTPRKVGNAYGWVEADQKGVKHAYFIVNRIEQGTELGKFLHEVGAHIGLENILSPALYQNLVGQLRKWAALNNDSLESRLAKAALARVESAQAESTRAGREGLDQAGQDSELIAYFLEEAVKAGVDPTATKANSPLGTWFMRLWTAFKRALGKLNIDNLDALTPQDVVDLAYGAARLSLVERKNAAPQRVTEAMPTQYGVDVPSHITSAKEAVHNALSDTYTGANRGLLGWMGINNIAERFGETLPILKSIEKTFNEMSHQAKLWLDRGDQIERMWSMLTPKQTELVSFIAGNATILQFDPSKDQANTPEKQEIAQKWKELQALDAANPKVKGTTTLLAAVQHYRDVHQESLDYLEDVLKQAQAAGASTHAIESVRDTVKALKKKQTHFWLPLHRFGDFHSVAMSPTLFALHQRREQHLDDVRANKANPAAWSKDDDKLFRKLRKDPKHYEAMGHESERAARRRATHWQGKGWHATSNINRYTSDQARAHLKPEIEAFEKMLAHTKLDAKVVNKLIDSYTDLLIEALPENHILKRQLDREGIAGWDPDMKRAFAKTAQSQAFAMSRLLHARKLGEQLGQLERQGDSFQPHATLARDLHAELIKQQELAMTRSEDPYWVRFATGFNYMSMLGGSPFFWALQLAQVPTITLPYLIGRNNANVTDTMGKLATAWGQAKDFVKWSVEANEWRAELDFSRAVKGVTPEEMQALKEMDEAGRFVFTIGQDLGAAAEGRNTKTARFIRSINAPTHTTELINRVSTGLAAYRISRKNGSAPKAAIEFALRTIDNTQVNMDPVMGARNLKTLFGRQGTQPFAKIIFQFWKFQQGMAYTTLTTMKDAWTHPDPKLRKQARDSAIGLTVSLMTTSGIFGLPFVGTGMMLLSFLAGLDGDDDEDDNVERLVKNWLKESPLPEVVADTLNKGFLSAILPTDAAPYLSPRFGLGNLMNPLGYARFDDAERGEDVVKELMFRVLGGPTGSSAAAFWDGIQAGLDGDYAKATEKVVPLKLMRDLARAYTLADQGVSTGKGEERIDPDDMSIMSWIWQAMGVTPMKKAMYHEGQAGVQALKMAVTGEREKLLARHAQARLKGEDVSEVTRDILRFNQKHPYARIKAENLRQAFGRRRDNRRKLTDTGILADKQNQPYLGNAAWTR